MKIVDNIPVFDNVVEAFSHYGNRIVKQDAVESANAANIETYKKSLLEVHPVFFWC